MTAAVWMTGLREHVWETAVSSSDYDILTLLMLNRFNFR
jgi:hypothetical protein